MQPGIDPRGGPPLPLCTEALLGRAQFLQRPPSSMIRRDPRPCRPRNQRLSSGLRPLREASLQAAAEGLHVNVNLFAS
jgi:hypothetical protein